MAGSADDIMKELMDKYNSQLNDSKKYQQDLKDSLDYNIRFAIDESELNKLQSIEEGIYKKQQEELNKISIMEINHQKEMNEWLIKNSVFQNKANQDFAKTRLEDAKKLYKLQTDTSAEYYRKLDEREARIYERANKNNRSLNETELKLLKRIEKERLNISKNVEETEKHSFINLKDVAKTAITDLFKFASNSFDTYIFNNIKAGITELSSNYEQNFTQIAGRIGSSSRSATHEFIGDILSTTNDNKYTKQGLNFNKDVFPEITNAVKNGFTGENAENIAISNAIDKKIMPWLDTTSETWVQMQYNMSNDALGQIKGQQLLLQATQEGNRILQNGVVSNITDALLPSLDNIVANTTDVEDFKIEMQAKAMYLMENGYTKQEAIKAINKEINAYQNPYKAITSNDVGDKLLALGHITGNDLLGSFASSMIGSGWVGSGAFAELTGIATGGETRSERSLKVYANEEEGIKKYLDLLKNKSKDEIEQLYKNTIEKLPEYVTATQAYDNKMQNQWAENTYVMNSIIHGNELQKALLDEVIKAKNGIITAISTVTVSNLFNKSNLTDNTINYIGNGTFNKIAGKLGSGLIPGASKIPGAGKLSFMSNGAGAVAGTAVGVTAGALIATKGVKEFNESTKIKNDKTSNDIEIENAKKGQIASGIATAGGAAGAAGIIALGASNPIGWAALAIGGLALSIKAVNDHFAELNDASAQVAANFDKSRESIETERQSREDHLLALKDNLDAYDTTTEKLQYLQQNGINVNESALQKVNGELDIYLNNLIKVNDTDAAMAENILTDIEAKLKNDTNVDIDNIKYELLKNYSAEKIADINGLDINKDNDKIWNLQKTALKKAGYTNEELNSLNKHWINGAANESELKDFLDSGAVQGKNIGSFEDHYEKDNIKISGVNYLLEQSGSNIKMIDYNEISNELGPYAEKIATLKRWKDNKNSVDYNEKMYEQYKKDILNLPQNYKTTLTYAFESINEKDAMSTWPNSLKGFKLGSSYIPNDMIAMVHKGERVLTDNQNKEYTEQLITGKTTTNIIELGLQDVVNAISKQTQDIISYLNQLSFNNRPSTSSVNMLSEMGNTRVII